MTMTHDDTTRVQAPRSSTLGSGHASNWTCARCDRRSGITLGRRLQAVRGVKRWVCAECAAK